MNEKKLFTNKTLVSLLIPLIIEQVLAATVGMADTVMVSSVGEAAVSAVSLVDQINLLLIQVFAAMATGGAVVAAQYIGREDWQNARATAKQLTYAATAIAIALGALALAFCAPVLSAIYGNIDADVMSGARVYFMLSAASYPFLALYNAGAALFRAMGDSRTSMRVSVVMNVVNVAGNALLIYVFGLGVAGAAIASLAARALAAVVVMARICRKRPGVYIDGLFRFEFKPEIVKKVLAIGVPNGCENGVFQVGKILVARVISSLGTSMIAANAVVTTLANIVCIPGGAIGMAMITVIGQCVGARRYDEARENVKKLMIASYGLMASIDIILFIAAPAATRMFNLTPEATETAVRVLRLYLAMNAVFWPLSFAFPNALRAAGDARFTMWVSMGSMLICRIGMCYLLVYALRLGLEGVFYAMFIDWFVRIAFFVLRYRSGKWKNARVIG